MAWGFWNGSIMSERIAQFDSADPAKFNPQKLVS